MSKNIKIIGGVVVVLAAVTGGLYIYGQKKLDSIEVHINDSLAKIQPMLPDGAKQHNVFTKGPFKSSGVYTIDYQDGTEKEKITVNYIIEHGFGSYFTGVYDINANTQIEGSVRDLLKYDGSLLVTTGTISRNGNADLKSKSPQITATFSDEQEKNDTSIFVLAPGEQTFKFNDRTGEVKTTAKFPNIKFTEKTSYAGTNTVDINDIEVKRDFHKDNSSLGTIDITVANVTSELVTLSNIDLNSNAELVNNKFNLKANGKIGKITVPSVNENNATLEVGYSLTGLDSQGMTYYKNLYSRFEKGEELSKEERVKVLEEMKLIASKGVNFSLDKLAATGSFGEINISGKMELNPSPVTDFSLEKNTHLGLNIFGKGKVAPMLALGIYSQTGIRLDEQNKDKFDLKSTYSNGVLTINGKAIENSPIAMMIGMSLAGIDEDFNKVLNKNKDELNKKEIPPNLSSNEEKSSTIN